jgi:tetratricopeptide (TPR) repeat protein
VRATARAGTGLAALATGDVVAAERGFTEALQLVRDPDGACSWITSLVHGWLGTMRLLQGQPGEAVADIERGLSVSRARGDRLTTYVALYNLAQAALALDDVESARRHVQEGIALSEETRDLANLAYFVETLAVVESRSGRPDRVGLLLGAASVLREEVGADIYGYYLPDETLRASAERTARELLGDTGFEDSRSRGRTVPPDDVIALVRPAATSDFR